MKIDTDVMAVLSVATTTDSNVVLNGDFDHKLYERTNKVLEAAGGKWNRKAKAHVFDADAATRIDQILLSGEVAVPKDEFNYFPTPPAVVEKLLSLANISPGMTLLEPSAGTGAIAWPCAAAGAKVDCYEIQQGNAFTLAMSAPHDLGRTAVADFLTVEPEPVYDRMVMNPSFAKQADIKHVLHALRFLKPGGLLVAVMSAGIEFRTNALTTAFLALVAERGNGKRPRSSSAPRPSAPRQTARPAPAPNFADMDDDIPFYFLPTTYLATAIRDKISSEQIAQ